MVGVLKGLMVWAGSLLVSAAGLVGCMSCHLQTLKSLGDLFEVTYWLRRTYGSSALSWAHLSYLGCPSRSVGEREEDAAAPHLLVNPILTLELVSRIKPGIYHHTVRSLGFCATETDLGLYTSI